MINKDFITFKLIGPSEIGGYHNFGLGNQMFQIATALSYAKDNDLTATFPDLKNSKFGNYTENIFKNLKTEPYDETSLEYEYYESSFTYTEIPAFKNIRFNGYFQSDLYFKDNIKLIKDTFKASETIKNYIYEKYGDIFHNATSCHFRFGDYKELEGKHPILTNTNYYKNALEMFSDTELLIFSDDIEACKKLKFLNKPNVKFISNEKDFIDLYMMSFCKNNIIANSTFSWWSAWLNNHNYKKVTYPECWFGLDKNFATNDLFPRDWKKINC